MQRIAFALLFSSMAFGACAATSQPAPASQARSLPPFSSIAVNGVGKVSVHKGPQSVKLRIDGDLIDLYETKVSGGRLTLGFSCGFRGAWALRGLRTCEIDVTMPSLDGIVINGSGELGIDEFRYGKLSVEANGACALAMSGSASDLSLSCTGSCSIHARDLSVARADLSITGAAKVELGVKEELKASITGSGQVLYWGSPSLSRKISGTGTVRRAGD